MVVVLGLGIAALLVATTRRWHAHAAVDLDAIVMCGAAVLALVGVAATLLGTVGALVPTALAVAVWSVAAAIHPWQRTAPRARTPIDRRRAAAVFVLLAGAAALRWPPIDHALAGRDQGTYALRAEWTASSGDFDRIDPVVRDAANEPDRPGAADLAGLYPLRREPWRQDVYEAGYRPGWYLADRERGLVVPQFLHLHPALSTVARWLGGVGGPGVLVVIEGVASVAAVLAVAGRLLPAGPWALFAAAAFALSPLGIWVHRNTLTEAPTGLFTLAATIGFARARDGLHGVVLGAALLGATAWVRGNAWITAPAVLAVLWLVPHVPARHRATAAFVAMLGGSVVIHGATVFPYLHDELARQFAAWGEPSALALVAVFGVGLVAWWSVDELVFGPRAKTRAAVLVALRSAVPWVAVVGLGAALAAWAVRAAGADGAPWSRLDALVPGIGIALVVPATIGILLALRPWSRHTASLGDVWLGAVAAVVVTTAWAYAGRNLPKFGLYYYGRYLVPELLPLACVAASFACARLHRRVAMRHPRGGAAIAGAAAIGIGVGVAWPLLATPATRLREYDGARRIVDALAERVPPDAIVVAGGEGWHHGHTFNQVAGALAMAHGRDIVPYVDREAAYATLHELLVTGPAATGRPPRRLFLLINEATHVLAARVHGAPRAALDVGLPPPFAARSVTLLELVTDRLTPTVDALPVAVTRDALRMGLVEVVVDPSRADAVHRVAFGDGATGAPPGLGIPGGFTGCLDGQTPVVFTVAPELAERVAAVVLVAAAEHAGTADTWRIAIDDAPRRTRAPGSSARSRATLGPLAVGRGLRTIGVRGAAKPDPDATCPHGALAELRLLGPEHDGLSAVTPESIVLVPERDLGHPVAAVAWVTGRGLSRLRPQLGEPPATRGTSMALTAATAIALAPEALMPGDYDVVVNLTSTRLSADARIRVWADDAVLGELDPPETRSSSWQSPPLSLTASGPATRWRLELVGGADDDVAWVRDLGLFAR